MKNIIIGGIPRSGKTTLAKEILKTNYNYNLIEEDVFLTIAYKIYVKYFLKNDENSEPYILETDVINNLGHDMFENYISCLRDTESSIGLIIDTPYLTMEQLKEYKDKGDIVIVLGCPSLTEKTFFENVRKYDTLLDRTYYENSYYLQLELNHYVNKTKDDKIKCQELGLDFFDTSCNREEIIKKIIEIINKQIS